MNNNEFRFRVQNLSYGWCRVNMLINDKEINFNAGYLDPNPLASFIEICAEFLIDRDQEKLSTIWQAHPG